ncbi:MAG TPA: transporter [Sphingomonas sp.]|nr:transporter [Sphingomonas sp.]
MAGLTSTILPVCAILIGAIASAWRRPSDTVVAGVQHLAAGVVFAAAAAEILPQVLHGESPIATLTGGAAGVALMLTLKAIGTRMSGPVAMLGAVAIDILIDGLVLGLAFVAGEKAGRLLTIALTLEVLFLGLTVTEALHGRVRSRIAIVGTTLLIGLLLPVGAAIATPVATLPTVVVTALLSFGLMALLYLVTEELLVEAHEKPDTPLITTMFFVGFLGLLLLEETAF